MQAKIMIWEIKSHTESFDADNFSWPQVERYFSYVRSIKLLALLFHFLWRQLFSLLAQDRASDNKPNLVFKFKISSLGSCYQDFSSKVGSAGELPWPSELESNACGMRGHYPPAALGVGNYSFNSGKAAQTLKIWSPSFAKESATRFWVPSLLL